MWYDAQTGLYLNNKDNVGRPRTIRQVLFSAFATNIDEIVAIRHLDKQAADYKERKNEIKNKVQGFTPAAYCESRGKASDKPFQFTGLMQLDWDSEQLKEYDVEEVKDAVFSLPFVAFCGLSISGEGFYALVTIAEPEKLTAYAEHTFRVFEEYALCPDTSKGRNPKDLRYVSYDANMLLRLHPTPLKIKNFRTKKEAKQIYRASKQSAVQYSSDKFITAMLKQVAEAGEGYRMTTIQRVAYALGGYSDEKALSLLKETILSNSQYAGGIEKALKCADDCFRAGSDRPFAKAQ